MIYAELMMRLITAPCVGILVGALEEGALFALLTILDSSEANFALSKSEAVMLAAIIGMIGGGFLGGIIGLVVALRDAEGPSGLLLGSAIGLAFGILLAIRVGVGGPVADPYMIVILSTIPAGASIGFVSAVLTAPRKEPQPTAEPSRSQYLRLRIQAVVDRICAHHLNPS